MKYNDIQKMFGFPENPNADLENLVGTPVPNVPDMPQPTAAPAPVSTQEGMEATDFSSLFEGAPADSQQSPQAPQEESQLQRLERLAAEMQKSRSKELEDANRRQMYQDMLAGVNSNLGLIVGGAQAMNTKAAVQAPRAGEIKQRDLAGEVERRYKGDQEALMDRYKALLKAQKDAEGISDYQKQRLELDRDRLGLMRDIEQGRGSRFYDNLGFRKEEKNELSDKQLEGITSFEKVEGLLKDIGPRAANFKDKLGPYAARLEAGKTLVPGMQEDPDFSAFRATTSDQLSQYIKSLSGLTVSDRERESLLTAVPTVNDKYDIFMAKLKEMKGRLDKYKNIELDAIKKYQGRGIKTSQTQDAPQEDVILRRDPKTGRTVKYDAKTKQPLGWAD